MLNKTAGQSYVVLGRACPPAKSLLTWFFLLENRREGRQLPYGGLDVCPDKTYQNKPVPFWQVVSAERRAVRLGYASSQSGETEHSHWGRS